MSTNESHEALPFGFLLELIICSDPWPTASRGNQDAVKAWADSVARSLGYADWVDAYHQLPADYRLSPPAPAGDACKCGECRRNAALARQGSPFVMDPLPERDASKANTEQGLYRKFDVRRTDGSDAPGGKHHGCEYFVLDVRHDPLAKAALTAYADAAQATHPALAANLRERYALAAAPAPAVDALGGAAKEMRRLAQECHDCGQDVHANTYYHCAGMVERIIEGSLGGEHIESAPAAMGRGNVVDHPRKPPYDETPLSEDAQSAAREADAALGAPAVGREAVANDSEVICPACTHQFRAIPLAVQRLMLDAGFSPPFTTPRASAGGVVGVTDATVEVGLTAACTAHGDEWPWKGASESDLANDRKAMRAALEAALAQPQATPRDSGDAWQPIETAPKDGETEILVWSDCGEACIGIRLIDCPDDAVCDRNWIAFYATHWQPLPAPPAQSPTGEPTKPVSVCGGDGCKGCDACWDVGRANEPERAR